MRQRDWAVAALLIGGALLLRLLTYRTALPLDVNADEFAWAWAGQSLLTQGTPASWSHLAGYANPGIIELPDSGQAFPYVRPWLDHPPLFAALVGSFALAAGERTPEAVTLDAIRLVPVLLSTMTVGLLFALTRRHLGLATATLAAALLAFTPAAIAASSLVEAEWLLAPLLLAALLLADRSTWLLFGVCALAPLVKLTGAAVGVTAAVYLVTRDRRRWRAATGCLLAALLGLGLVAAYGAVIDWSQFVAVYTAQAGRHTASALQTWTTFMFGARAGYGGTHAFDDPLWYLGLGAFGLGALVAAMRRRWLRLNVLMVPVLLYSLVIAFIAPTSPGSGDNGWYRLAIYPLVYAALAWFAVTLAVQAWRAVTRGGAPRQLRIGADRSAA